MYNVPLDSSHLGRRESRMQCAEVSVMVNNKWWWWSWASCHRMSVDLLGTNCDQCRSIVQYCFTSTETIRLVRMDSPDGHLDSHTAPELWLWVDGAIWFTLYMHESMECVFMRRLWVDWCNSKINRKMFQRICHVYRKLHILYRVCGHSFATNPTKWEIETIGFNL